jgi:hypothetical protein
MLHPNHGDPQSGSDRAFEPAGNRPAQNARQATPGSVFSQTKFPSSQATDFLGLEQQVASEPQGVELFAPPATGAGAADEVEQEPYEEAWEEGEAEEREAADSEDGVHRSWVDDSPATRSRGMLPKVAAALGLGMAGMTAFVVLKGGGGEPALPEPLTPEMNSTPGYEERLLEGAPLSQRAEADAGTAPAGAGAEASQALEQVAWLSEPGGPDADEATGESGGVEGLVPAPSSTESTPAEEPAGEEPASALAAPVQGEAALAGAEDPAGLDGLGDRDTTREPAERRFAGRRRAPSRPAWQEVGETPPPWSVAGFAATPEAGSPPAAEAVSAPAPAPVGTLVVIGDSAGASSLEEHPYWEGDATRVEPVGEGLDAAVPSLPATTEGDSVPFSAAGEVALSAGGQDTAPVEQIAPEPTPVVAQAAGEPPSRDRSAETAAVQPEGEVGLFGPVLPAGEAPLAESTASEEPAANTRVRRIDSSQVVQPDQRGPRLATPTDLKGVWLAEDVPPMWAIDGAQKVLTPQVGQVRVILVGNEIFHGRLYAMGEGRVWINNESFGQMGLEGAKVQKILRIDTADPTPGAGRAASDELNGLESVRVKTPGGILFGKVIARDEERTTIVIKDGTRVTLASNQVEFLDEVPSVALKREGAAKEKAEQPADAPAPRVTRESEEGSEDDQP